jgi:hypothetical protein
MTYTIDASHPDRTRIIFSSPYEFVAELRFVQKASDAEPLLATALDFQPGGASALKGFIQGLTPERLAAFVDGVAEHALTLAASLNTGS